MFGVAEGLRTSILRIGQGIKFWKSFSGEAWKIQNLGCRVDAELDLSQGLCSLVSQVNLKP